MEKQLTLAQVKEAHSCGNVSDGQFFLVLAECFEQSARMNGHYRPFHWEILTTRADLASLYNKRYYREFYKRHTATTIKP